MRGRALALLSCALLLLSGCNGTGEITPDYAPDDAHRLTVYTSHKEEVYWPIVKEFEERTGIWVEVVEGGTNDLLELIDKGFDDGQADVMFGGGVENLSFYAHCFTPYVCVEADAIDPQFASPDGLWTPFSALPVVLVYNPKLVSAGEITGWADLLSPTFQGKIAFADPAVSGSSFTALVTMVQALGGDEEAVLTAFAENLDGQQLSGSGAVLDAVVDGAAWVGVTLEETARSKSWDASLKNY